MHHIGRMKIYDEESNSEGVCDGLHHAHSGHARPSSNVKVIKILRKKEL